MLFDNGRYKKFFGKIRSADPLGFVDSKPYPDRLKVYNKKFSGSDAVVVGQGEIAKIPALIAAMEYGFMGGSMGSAVGEKLTRAIERCLDRKLPLVIVSCSGGARMQEGILSLMQLGKVSAALARMRAKTLPFISVLTDPTTGGVTASYAMLGDLNIAEPGALIGFAGPRVIEQTIRQTLPEGFQRSEFLLEHGMLDMVVPRQELKATVARCLSLLR
jgi:acetyl-CoA carboxylase carboxyl transferase subunit beta